MHKFAVALVTSLFSSAVALAFWPEATDSSLEIGVGYRQDSLQYKTKSDMTSSYNSYDSYSSSSGYYSEFSLPYKLESKMKWKDLSIWQIEANGKYVTCDSVYLRGGFDYGWITSGKSTNKNYIEDESSYYGSSSSGYSSYSSDFEFEKSKAHVSGHVYDAKLALGYQFKLCDDSFAIAPLIGYSWNGQHLQNSHIRQEWYSDESVEDVAKARDSSSSYSSYDSYYSSYSDYSSSGREHSTYHTRWNGPFIGFDFDYRFGFGCGCDLDWQLFGAYEFHWATFHGEGELYARDEYSESSFKFRQHASNAYGNVLDIGLKWDFCECWTLALKGEFQWWWADHGHSVVKIAEERAGNVRFTHDMKTPLRNVQWDSAAVILDLGMVF